MACGGSAPWSGAEGCDQPKSSPAPSDTSSSQRRHYGGGGHRRQVAARPDLALDTDGPERVTWWGELIPDGQHEAMMAEAMAQLRRPCEVATILETIM